MFYKEVSRILSVALEPRACVTEAETVAPGVHIQHQPVAAHTIDEIGQKHLQVTDGGFFKIVTTCITIKSGATIFIHADHMAGLVQA